VPGRLDLSGNGFSWGGYLGADMSGAAALAGIHWPRLYDPESLADQDAVRDYWRQINVLLHEFGHVFGAGGAEYYAVLTPDDTGEAPLSEISLIDPDNAYFQARPDLRSDPMLTMPSLTTRAEYLDAVRYSELSAATMNGTYRWPVVRAPIPDLARLRVHLRHRDDGTPVAGARVRAWRVHTGNPILATELLSEAVSDADGSVTWSWEAESVDSITTDSIRMLKIAKDGYRPVGHPVTWIDLSTAAVLRGQSVMEEVVLMDNERLRLRWKSPGVLRVTGGTPDTRFALERASQLPAWTPWLTGRLTDGAFETAVAPADSPRPVVLPGAGTRRGRIGHRASGPGQPEEPRGPGIREDFEGGRTGGNGLGRQRQPRNGSHEARAVGRGPRMGNPAAIRARCDRGGSGAAPRGVPAIPPTARPSGRP
jgi:hypothetical protein